MTKAEEKIVSKTRITKKKCEFIKKLLYLVNIYVINIADYELKFATMKSIVFILALFLTFTLQAQSIVQFGTADGFPTDNIYQIAPSTDGDQWLSTVGDGLIQWKSDGDLIHYKKENCPINADSIFATYKDSKNNQWIATYGSGLLKINEDGWWEVFTTENSDLPSNFVTNIAEDSKGNIWVATIEFMSALLDDNENGGIVKITADNEWTHYSKENSPLLTNNTFNLLVDEEDNVWIGTIRASTPTEFLDDGGGLCKLTSEGEWFIYTTENSGIGADNVMSLVKDDSGNIYTGSVDGYLSRFNVDGTWNEYRFDRIGTTGFWNPIELNEPASLLSMCYANGDLHIGFGPSDLLCMPGFNNSEIEIDISGLIIIKDIETELENLIQEYDRILEYSDLLSLTILLEHFENYSNYAPTLLENISDLYIPSIKVDEQNRVWIGTMGKGLCLLDRNNDEIVDDDLPTVNNILEPTFEGVMITSIDEILLENNVKIYPNPTTDFLSIEWSDQIVAKKLLLTIYNNAGNLIYSNLLNTNSSSHKLNINHLPKGMYQVNLQTEQNKFLVNNKIVID